MCDLLWPDVIGNQRVARDLVLPWSVANSLATTARSNVRRAAARLGPKVVSNLPCAFATKPALSERGRQCVSLVWFEHLCITSFVDAHRRRRALASGAVPSPPFG